jgi:uncharacterized protein YwgA
MAHHRNLRFKDVLLSLGATTKRNVAVQRIQLQKFIYLQDVFTSVWRVVAKPARFQPEKRGPYDKHIQNAVDALAFRGLVEVTSLSFQEIRQTRSSYRLTPSGQKAVKELIVDTVLHEEFLHAEEIADEIDRRGWEKIVQIVYSEPTYVVERDHASGQVLQINDPMANVTTQIVKLFQSAWSQDDQRPISIRCFIQIAFLVFDQYRARSIQHHNSI